MTLCNITWKLPFTCGEIKRKAFEDDFIKGIKIKRKDKDRQISSAYSICNEVVTYNDRVFIPAAFQKEYLKNFFSKCWGWKATWEVMSIGQIWTGTSGIHALSAKSLPIKLNPWLLTDGPWSRIDIDFAGPLDGFYNLIVVESFSKWLEIFRC